MEHAVTRSHPIPMQDEVAIGILGRFARMNAISSLDLAAKTIRGQTNKRYAELLWQLAEVCGKSSCEFSSKHSVMPVLRPISWSAKISLERWITLHQHRFRVMNCLQGHIRWCQECYQNDIDKHNFSYWRRSHQIVGVDSCPHHLTPLVQTSQKFAIHNPGHPATIPTDIKTPTTTKLEMENTNLIRMQEIMVGLLQRSHPIGIQVWLNIIRVRCNAAGLRIEEISILPFVSDLIRERFPNSWLWRYMPQVACKSPNTYVPEIDGACFNWHSEYPALTYASILSVLFDSSEQALQALDATNLHLISSHQEILNEAASIPRQQKFSN